MNSVDFFWMINEIIQENMNEMSESERGVLMETLKELRNSLRVKNHG